jgi:hypothetical protein
VLQEDIRMSRSLFVYLVIAAMLGALLRDLQVWLAAKIFCWRKRRESQREAQKQRELHQLAAELAAVEKAEQERKKKERIAAVIPYPRLLHGPRVITIRNDKDFLLVTKCLHANFIALGKSIVDADFESN